jgi:hypothetical protein
MLENTIASVTRSRMLKSARLLKAFYEQKLSLSLDLLTKEPEEPMSAGMQFDLLINSWGVWGLRSSAPLSDRQQADIAADFHNLLAAFERLETERLDLILMEQKFNATRESLPSNVIPLHRLRVSPAASREDDKRWLLKLDCLIESPELAEIHKMAFELHTQSRRYAFFKYHDLDRASRLNLSELLQLGAVTIYVSNIVDLSSQEQEVLRQLIAQDSKERPLLMVGARMPYSDLRSDPAIHLEFLALLSRAYIKLTRPFSEYKQNGLIHYFLDSLSQNPT